MCIHVDTAVRALMYMHACVLNATRQLESQFRDRGVSMDGIPEVINQVETRRCNMPQQCMHGAEPLQTWQQQKP